MKEINITDRSKLGHVIFYGSFLILITWLVSLQLSVPVQRAQAFSEADITPKQVSEASEVSERVVEGATDKSAEHIYEYLVGYGSPHPELAYTIAEESAKYGVNPYIITAIACQESSCFKNCYENNCTGYGIGDAGMYGRVAFDSSEEAMAYMIQAYSENPRGYRRCDADIQCIGESGYNSRESWMSNVSYFYQEISR